MILNLIDWEKVIVKPWMKKSFLIYALHPMVCSLIAKSCTLLLPNKSILAELVTWLAYFVVGVPFVLLIDKIIEKIIPRTRKLFLGGRG